MLPCLWMGGKKKRKKDRSNSLPETARAGQNCRDGWYNLLLLWSCWGSEQRKGPPRPKPRPSKKRYRPRVSKPLGMTQAGRLLAKAWLGRRLSTKIAICRAVWVLEGSEVPVLRGVPLWILVGQSLLSKARLR
ncbi:hypothetical protein QBC45DRAFT_401351 [Copromyces sp. CBS 386.78]|nr:hypothetical protein QBC45DRAFT_401351 [Copromyces sp. CBS 386.78]